MTQSGPSSTSDAVQVVWARSDGSPNAADELLRVEVARLTGARVHDVQTTRSCARCGSSTHGRPTVRSVDGSHPPHVSLSRAGAVVLVAVSTHGPVGVDVERLDAARFSGFDAVTLHRDEVAPTVESRVVTWVRKESLLKASGRALNVDPRMVRLSDPDQPPRLVEWSAVDPPEAHGWMWDLSIPGHAACVTVLSDLAPRVSLLREAAAGPVPATTPRTTTPGSVASSASGSRRTR